VTPRCRIASLGVSLPGRRLLLRGSVDHAVAAGKQCLAASRSLPADVEVLINAGVHRDGHICEPAMACFIQDRLGINPELQGRPTLSFDLACGAAGMLLAVETVAAMLAAGAARVGLVVSSEVNTDRRPDPSYPWPVSGAAVLLDLAPRSGVGFGAFATVQDDRHAGLATSEVSLAVKRGRLTVRRDPKLEDAMLEATLAAAARALAADGLEPADVDLVVPAQISPSFLGRLPGALGIAADRVVDLTAELPDTHSTSVFLALHRVWQQRPPEPGQTALLLACGSGVTAVAANYRT
jgi:3-oxoacyl-[acyl-carrier-protein] synthase III